MCLPKPGGNGLFRWVISFLSENISFGGCCVPALGPKIDPLGSWWKGTSEHRLGLAI